MNRKQNNAKSFDIEYKVIILGESRIGKKHLVYITLLEIHKFQGQFISGLGF